MFQDFRRRTTPETGGPRLGALRAAMSEAGVDAFLIPRSDAHQGENVAARDERLAWLTGFTGSAGLSIATRDKAAIFVDGRYRLQVRDQVDLNHFEPLRQPEDKPEDWLKSVLPGGGRIGFDPWLHTASQIEGMEQALGPHRITLARVENLIDRIWDDQPPAPAEPIVPHPETLAGRSAGDKRAEIASALTARNLAALVLTLPDSIAWLFNIRGSDIARTPVPLGFAILASDGTATLFVAPGQDDEALRAHLGPDVRLAPREAFPEGLDRLSGRVSLDKARAPVSVSDRLGASGRVEIVWETDPCILPKACKTPAEVAGARSAHRRDGLAMARFLRWLEGAAPEGALTEIDVVARLEAFRAESGALRDISFDTICGAGSNGAIVHYRVTEESNRPILPGTLLLVDSGGQYVDGTTDITRTLAIGDPPADAVRAFTLVLKGLVALSRQRWPSGLAGRDLDPLARAALWQAGLDYDHGTGHGVGSYLGVHEGPQNISRRGLEPILPGMVVSIEPGYYREGAFGIRIENLVVARAAEIPPGGDREMLGFETLTLAPIDRRLIDVSLLNVTEQAWLDDYHGRVFSELAGDLDAETRGWLETACAPLADYRSRGHII